jgi:hypothetical protein
MTKPDLKHFKLPEGCTYFLVVGPYNSWGRDKTAEGALKQANCPAGKILGILAGGDSVYVDEVGTAFAKVTVWKKD